MVECPTQNKVFFLIRFQDYKQTVHSLLSGTLTNNHRFRHSDNTAICVKLDIPYCKDLIRSWSKGAAYSHTFLTRSDPSFHFSQIALWIKSKSYKIQCDKEKESPVKSVDLRELLLISAAPTCLSALGFCLKLSFANFIYRPWPDLFNVLQQETVIMYIWLLSQLTVNLRVGLSLDRSVLTTVCSLIPGQQSYQKAGHLRAKHWA